MAAPESPHSVLVADDDPITLDIVARTVATLGVPVRTAADGDEALASVRQSPPRLAILDLSMPGLTGYELARAIRRIPGAAGTRLVALTASRPVQDSQASADSGFEEHWVKPMGSELLKAMVARLLA